MKRRRPEFSKRSSKSGAGGRTRRARSAIRFDAWLHNEAHANDTDRVPVKRIYQYGPNCVRDSRDLHAALAILTERGRARIEEDGRRRVVAINPALLDARE